MDSIIPTKGGQCISACSEAFRKHVFPIFARPVLPPYSLRYIWCDVMAGGGRAWLEGRDFLSFLSSDSFELLDVEHTGRDSSVSGSWASMLSRFLIACWRTNGAIWRFGEIISIENLPGIPSIPGNLVPTRNPGHSAGHV
eukprot:1395335-Amorphochlora_amoeboformis.AAC.1